MTRTSSASRQVTRPTNGHAVYFLWLYTRGRRVAGLVIGLAVVALAAWVWADWLVSRGASRGPIDRALVTPMAPLLGAVLISDGLGYFDSELEGSTSVRWWLLRTGHVVAATTVVGAVLAATVLYQPQIHGAFEMARNLLGYVGIVAASAVVLGARLAWLPATTFAAATFAAVPKPVEEFDAWWTWAWQPWRIEWARPTAVVLFAIGSALYIVLGARSSREIES